MAFSQQQRMSSILKSMTTFYCMSSRCSRALYLVWPSKACIKNWSWQTAEILSSPSFPFSKCQVKSFMRSRMGCCKAILKEVLPICSQVAAGCKCSQPLPHFGLHSDHITQAPKLSVAHSTGGFSTFMLGWLWPAAKSPPSHSLTGGRIGEKIRGVKARKTGGLR